MTTAIAAERAASVKKTIARHKGMAREKQTLGEIDASLGRASANLGRISSLGTRKLRKRVEMRGTSGRFSNVMTRSPSLEPSRRYSRDLVKALRQVSAPSVALVHLHTEHISSLDRAVGILSTLVESEQLSRAAARAEAARALRRAGLDQSRINPRVASVAVLLSDALLNSPTLEPSAERRDALRFGRNLLVDPFVGNEQEEDLFLRLTRAGWEMTPPFDREAFAALSGAGDG